MSASTANLLVELFVEELPPKALKKLGEAFASDVHTQLRWLKYLEDGSLCTTFATPRRLGVHITSVRAVCADQPVRTKLMPVQVAFDGQGQPTAALKKRLDKDGAGLSDVQRAFEGGKEFVYLDRVAKGRPLEDALQGIVQAAIENLPIPKVMSYQLADGWTSVNFVRPAHGLVVLHGDVVVPVQALGLVAGRATQGHRFEAAQPRITLRDADHYAEQLASEGAVIASFDARRAEVARQLQAAAAAQGLTPIDDDALLDEVTALVERPKVLTCQFETEFLDVPQECLILTMKANQKYFPLLDASGKLTHKFLVVSNIAPADASAVVQGNERVVRPRLADAKFFFDQDRKRSLESRVPGLAKVVYHNKLGTQGERVERVIAIARVIGQQLGGDALAHQADRAALLAKADLLTDMVGEFPELQGVMGGYYARHDGESEAIAHAIEDHYKPRFAGDSLPRNPVGLALALADKLETLVGLFGIGQVPTGDKDPFALRRHALGVIRMLIERDLPLAVPELVVTAGQAFGSRIKPGDEVTHFMFDRLVGYLREQGYSAQEVDAVVAVRPPRWGQLPQRLAAVRAFAALAESQSLAAANKRIGNILKKSEGAAPAAAVDPARLVEPAEKALAAAVQQVQPKADAHYAAGHYTESLRELAVLKGPVDAFFDAVMVNADDPALRANRLALLASLHEAMNRVADLSRLAA
jgi:glycyl-tRNA synthetase beta chain